MFGEALTNVVRSYFQDKIELSLWQDKSNTLQKYIKILKQYLSLNNETASLDSLVFILTAFTS